MLVTKKLTVAIDFHSMGKITMEVNGYRQLFGYWKIFKKSGLKHMCQVLRNIHFMYDFQKLLYHFQE